MMRCIAVLVILIFSYGQIYPAYAVTLGQVGGSAIALKLTERATQKFSEMRQRDMCIKGKTRDNPASGFTKKFMEFSCADTLIKNGVDKITNSISSAVSNIIGNLLGGIGSFITNLIVGFLGDVVSGLINSFVCAPLNIAKNFLRTFIPDPSQCITPPGAPAASPPPPTP
jgi:hypothetical protein